MWSEMGKQLEANIGCSGHTGRQDQLCRALHFLIKNLGYSKLKSQLWKMQAGK